MPLSYGLVPHLSKKLSKFPNSHFIIFKTYLNSIIYIYIYISSPSSPYVVLLIQISVTISRHSSLSSIASSRSSRLHPVSFQCCCRYVLVGRPRLTSLCEGSIGKRRLYGLYLSNSLHLIFVMILEIGDRWLFSCCFEGCCFQESA